MKCNSFGSCGSCTLYDSGYEEQLLGKITVVSDLLLDYFRGEIEVFESIDNHYRSRAEFRIWHSGDVCSYAMGNLQKNGHVNISECPKVEVAIEKKQWRLLDRINENKILSRKLFGIEFLSTSTDELLVTMLYHRKLDNEWSALVKKLGFELDIIFIGRSRKQKFVLTKEYVIEELCIDNTVYKYRYYEGGFTQPNREINIKMISWALKCVQDIGGGDLLESYCGLGNFTLPLSKVFTKVLATEVSKSSIRSAKENCEINGISNISFVRLSSSETTEALNKEREFRRLEGIDLDSYSFSCVLVDPPRAGIDDATQELISKIDNIIYISCNPETLARDLEVLTRTHYLKNVAIFDQFPNTKHIESGVFLSKI